MGSPGLSKEDDVVGCGTGYLVQQEAGVQEPHLSQHLSAVQQEEQSVLQQEAVQQEELAAGLGVVGAATATMEKRAAAMYGSIKNLVWLGLAGPGDLRRSGPERPSPV
jgi:hypothetical protein